MSKVRLTSYDSINIDADSIEWFRKHAAESQNNIMGSASVTVKADRECPQVGVLSSLLWVIVLDGLL